ncbi:MAG: DUF4440 domain-containing protein [Terracidiphilus sp.]
MSPAGNDLAKHLRTLEESLLDPAIRRDSAQVAALLAEDFLEFGSSGKVWTRDQILDLLATEKYEPPAIEDFRWDLIANGVALVTYKTVRTDPHSGERTTTLRSSLWTERSGEWRVRFHQGTPALPG